MSSRRHRATETLVRSVRNRLWLASGLRLLAQGLWFGAALLLAGGLYHLLVQPLPGAALAILALLAPVTALLTALWWQRPGTASAARQTDAWFQGHNLITSAMELRRQPVPTPMALLVLERAETAARQWQARLAGEHPLRWPQRSSLALLLAGVGLFLLQLPSKGWLAATPPRLQDAQPATGITTYPGRLRQGEVPPLAITTLSPETTRPPAQAPAGQPPAQPEGTETRTAQPDTPAEDTVQDTPATASAQRTSRNDGSRRAGDQPGRRHDRQRMESIPLAVQEAALMRRAGDPGQGGTGGMAPDPASLPAGTLPATLVAAARPVEQPYRSDFSPALRRYIARYFQELQTPPP